MEHKQQLELAQVLKLSPTLLQSMGILQMTTLELEEYLQDLALENPVMEETPGARETAWDAFASRVPWLAGERMASGGPAVGEPGRRDREPESLAFFLAEQLDRQGLDQPLLAVCRYLVDLLDDHGRLDPGDLADLTQAGVPEALLEEGVAALQSLDPAGVGARSAGESLALQLKRQPGDHRVALAICEKGLDLLAREQYGALARRLGVPRKQVEAAAQAIRALDPNPVGAWAVQGETEYLRPDAWVAEIDGTLQVFVNQWDLPQFHLSPAYLQMAREDFFRGRTSVPGPLLGRELAETLDLHPSTVSRTLGHKALQCRQGVFPLGWFFGRAVGEGLSPQGVQARIAQLVAEEDSRCPYSDQGLMERLQAEGIPVARRTVAKYRQALGLPPSYRRKR